MKRKSDDLKEEIDDSGRDSVSESQSIVVDEDAASGSKSKPDEDPGSNSKLQGEENTNTASSSKSERVENPNTRMALLRNIEYVNMLDDVTFNAVFKISRDMVTNILDHSESARPKQTTLTNNSLLALLWYLGSEDDLQVGCSIFNLSADDFEKNLESTAEFLDSTLSVPAQLNIPHGVYCSGFIESVSKYLPSPSSWGILNKYYFRAKNGPDGYMHIISEQFRTVFRYVETSETELPDDLELKLSQAAFGLRQTELESKKILYADLNYLLDETLNEYIFIPGKIPKPPTPGEEKQKRAVKRAVRAFQCVSCRFPRLKYMWRFSPKIIKSAFILNNYCVLKRQYSNLYYDLNV